MGTVSLVPRRPEPAPSEYARAVTAAIRELQRARGLSIAEISRGTGHSPNYLAERLRDEKSFTLTDVERLGVCLGFDAAEFLGAIRVPGEVIAIARRRGVGAAVQDRLDGESAAAGDDDTLAEPEREAP